MPNSISRKNGHIEFDVLPEHIALLKNLNFRQVTCIAGVDEQPDSLDGPFVNQLGIDGYRTFGDSGNIAVEALRVAGVHPTGPDGTYTDNEICYGRYLVLSLPLAYEAIMNKGEVSPGPYVIDYYGLACHHFRKRRVLDYWRDGIADACRPNGVNIDDLIVLLLNIHDCDSPIDVINNMALYAPGCEWVKQAQSVLLDHAVAKYRTENPGEPDAGDMSDGEIREGLASGKLRLVWDW